ncbi:MAG: flagellar export protein FliJ [Syntrophotaleaceae bacterium]
MADKFKLQTVLNHRQRLEQVAQQKLAEALRREALLHQKVALQRSDLCRLQQELTVRQQSGIGVDELQRYRLSINRQRSLLSELLEQAQRLQREVASNRELLAEAAREKKLLEKLKEKKEAEQRYQENRLEMAKLDDIALRLGKHSL